MNQLTYNFNFPVWTYLMNIVLFIYGPDFTKIIYLGSFILAEVILDLFITKENKDKRKKQNFIYLIFKKIVAYSLYVFMAGAVGDFFEIGEKLRSFVLVILFIIQISQLFVKLSIIGFEKETNVLKKPFLRLIKESELGQMIIKDVQTEQKEEEKGYTEKVKKELIEKTKQENVDDETASSSGGEKELGGKENEE